MSTNIKCQLTDWRNGCLTFKWDNQSRDSCRWRPDCLPIKSRISPMWPRQDSMTEMFGQKAGQVPWLQQAICACPSHKGNLINTTFSTPRIQPQCIYLACLCDYTCATSRASLSWPLDTKKLTSFFTSPMAMQYGMTSSLSSWINWSALLKI